MRTIALMAIAILLASCSRKGDCQEENGVYYWRTTYAPTDTEKEFLDANDVGKVYMRMFDVGCDSRGVVPIATLQFLDTMPPGKEIVPVVFITPQAVQYIGDDFDIYAQKIVGRVDAMSKKHSFEFGELQLDCDWTEKTESAYFKLCKSVKEALQGKTLSSTVRLHQLRQAAPPVDKAVLMVYNTSNFHLLSASNSIFDRDEILPYIQGNALTRYPLPFDVAFPVFGWKLHYSHGYDDKYRFNAILRTFDDLDECPDLKKNGEFYEAQTDFHIGDAYIYEGDLIKIEKPRYEDIIAIKAYIDKKLADKPHSTILYHLDQKQFTQFTPHEISKIYSRN